VPSASAVPCPHDSVASLCVGAMPPVHEYPVAGALQLTAPSTAHMAVGVGVVPPPVSQQYAVPAPPGAPAPQLSDELTAAGVSLPEHENPMEGLTHPVTLGSCAHVPVDPV
jgi:hypothetical protein